MLLPSQRMISAAMASLSVCGRLVIGELSPVDFEIDLWNYIKHLQAELESLRFQRGASTVCVVPSPNGPVKGMASPRRGHWSASSTLWYVFAVGARRAQTGGFD
jgi:hypothetical protein